MGTCVGALSALSTSSSWKTGWIARLKAFVFVLLFGVAASALGALFGGAFEAMVIAVSSALSFGIALALLLRRPTSRRSIP